MKKKGKKLKIINNGENILYEADTWKDLMVQFYGYTKYRKIELDVWGEFYKDALGVSWIWQRLVLYRALMEYNAINTPKLFIIEEYGFLRSMPC